MPRYNFVLPEEQFRELRAKAEATGLAMSDHVRRALDAYLHGQVICLPCSGSLNSGQLQFSR